MSRFCEHCCVTTKSAVTVVVVIAACAWLIVAAIFVIERTGESKVVENERSYIIDSEYEEGT